MNDFNRCYGAMLPQSEQQKIPPGQVAQVYGQPFGTDVFSQPEVSDLVAGDPIQPNSLERRLYCAASRDISLNRAQRSDRVQNQNAAISNQPGLGPQHFLRQDFPTPLTGPSEL
jgi:hypothetical protein